MMFDLKSFRADFNLKQSDIQKVLGVTQGFISRIENGKESFPSDYIGILSDKYGKEVIDRYTIAKKIKLSQPDQSEFKLVPLVNLDAVAGMNNMNEITATDAEFIERLIPFEDAQDGDLCIPVTGNSMIPTCPPGCIVMIRNVPLWRDYFGYGNLFMIQLSDGRRILKEVAKSEIKDYVLCISHNKSVAAEDLPIGIIRSVWKVIKVLTDKGW